MFVISCAYGSAIGNERVQSLSELIKNIYCHVKLSYFTLNVPCKCGLLFYVRGHIDDKLLIFDFETSSLEIRLKIKHNFNTLRTGLLNCLNAHSRGLTFRHRASCI